MKVLGDSCLITLPRHARADGQVVVAEAAAQVPFAIARLFTITAPAGAERGRHAHRLCSQFMICVSGAVDVVCDDGRDCCTFVLDQNNLALVVHPTIWNTIIYRQYSVVVVLCDRPYEADDYIHDYAEFIAMRNVLPP